MGNFLMVHNLNIPCLDREGVLSGCYLPSPMALPWGTP